MPLVEVEVVGDEQVASGFASVLAHGIGKALGSPPASVEPAVREKGVAKFSRHSRLAAVMSRSGPRTLQ